MKTFAVLGLTLLISAATALQCFQCEWREGHANTTAQTDCYDDVVPENYKMECKYPGTNIKDWQCVKKTGKITITDENDKDEDFKYVRRYCSPGANIENSCKESDALHSNYGTVQKAMLCTCDSDGCNSAGMTKITFVAFIISVVSSLFYSWY